MPEREQVAKALECCSGNKYICSKCPFLMNDIPDADKCQKALMRKALKLLKGDEPVKPYIGQSNTDRTIHVRCGACQTAIDKYDAYCRACGREVKWE